MTCHTKNNKQICIFQRQCSNSFRFHQNLRNFAICKKNIFIAPSSLSEAMSLSQKRDANNHNVRLVHRESWYHGIRSRAEVESVFEKEGDFLVRIKYAGPDVIFVLCVCLQSATDQKPATVQHYSLFNDLKRHTWELLMFRSRKSRKSAKSTVEGASKQPVTARFRSIIDLVNHYKVSFWFQIPRNVKPCFSNIRFLAEQSSFNVRFHVPDTSSRIHTSNGIPTSSSGKAPSPKSSRDSI